MIKVGTYTKLVHMAIEEEKQGGIDTRKPKSDGIYLDLKFGRSSHNTLQ